MLVMEPALALMLVVRRVKVEVNLDTYSFINPVDNAHANAVY
jgi:hypothetical protein